MKREEIALSPGSSARASSQASVDVVKLSKRFGSVAALDEVSLQIREGDFFALLGPSGCGKTTLLRIIGGFENPTGGDVLIGGRSVIGQPPYQRPTNMIFQHLALFPHMNVYDNIAFGLRMKRQGRDAIRRRVTDALSLVRLAGFEQRKIDELSGGQKQRVAMARALVNDPAVLLLDEPLGALDLQLRLQMHEELRRLHRALGGTFIFVTHDQSEAITLANRIAVMNAGKVLQVGSPEEIYHFPQTRFVAEFIGHSNFLEAEVLDCLAPDRVVFDCAGVRLTARSDRQLGRGERATLAVRYEKLRLAGGSPSAGATAIRATLVDRNFMGSTIRLSARTAGGTALLADIADGGAAARLKVGEPVDLEVDERSITVLKNT
jgi:spermidine/putrescine transport system ATP-binding protein